MRNNMSTNRLLRVSSEHRTAIDLRHNLVGNYDCDAKLVRNSLESAQELSQVHLASGQLTTAAKVSTIESSCAIDHHQCETILRHQGCGLQQKLVLLIGVVCSCICDIVQHLLLIKTESLSNRNESFWSESTLSVDIHGHAFATALCDRQLARDAKRVANLCFACPKLSEDLSDRAGLHTAS
jgi:hypothetical protein